MNDNVAPIAGEPKILLSIVADERGAIAVNSPVGLLGDKVQCLGLLEIAKQLVIQYKAQPSMIQPASVIPFMPPNSRS